MNNQPTRRAHHRRLAGYRRGAGQRATASSATPSSPNSRTIGASDDPIGPRRCRATSRSPGSASDIVDAALAALRANRHRGQQRRDLHRQAIRRIHRRGLRRHHRRQPPRVLRGIPRGDRRRCSSQGDGGHLVDDLDDASSNTPTRRCPRRLASLTKGGLNAAVTCAWPSNTRRVESVPTPSRSASFKHSDAR